MIQFLDFRDFELPFDFGFWDGSRNVFIKFNGRLGWSSWEDFQQDCPEELLVEFERLCPDWVLK